MRQKHPFGKKYMPYIREILISRFFYIPKWPISPCVSVANAREKAFYISPICVLLVVRRKKYPASTCSAKQKGIHNNFFSPDLASTGKYIFGMCFMNLNAGCST